MSKNKNERFSPDRDAILEFLRNEKKHVNVNTVLDRLKIPRAYRGTVKRIMKELANEGAINRDRNRYASHESKKTITGKIDLRNAFGFLENPAGGDDIFISPRQAEELLPGDEIEIWPVRSRSGGLEGELKRIVKRTDTPLMCKVKRAGREVYAFLPFKSSPAIRLKKPEEKYGEGDLILVRVEQKDSGLYGEVVSHIYDRSDINLYKQFILNKCEIRQAFPGPVTAEAERIEAGGDTGARVDLRGETIITIDPKDAKDFDDAVSLRKEGGAYMLGVHIADVSHYVKEASALDSEASLRGTSVYLPGSVVPMLPEKLSNDVCSLKPGVDRMTFSVFMEMDAHGNLEDFYIKESVIRSKRRFTYEEVEEILQKCGMRNAECGMNVKSPSRIPNPGSRIHAGDDDPTITETLLLMRELKEKLQKKFRENGAIDFTSGEPVFAYDEEGKVADIVRKETLESHKIIEYFMISANICAADFIERHNKYGMYRVHDTPAGRDIEEFNTFMRALGLEVKLRKGTNPEFQRVLASIRDNPKRNMIERNLLRAMKLAKYSEKNTGHFGLALPSYTHFTSPIRRYADVVVHRLIKHFLGVEAMKDTGREYLKEAAAQICDCEERAEQAENDMFRLFALDFLKERLGDDFEAVITKVTKNGLLCELSEYPVEGFVTFDSMYEDYYVFDPYIQAATGKRTKKKYRTGDNISVIICRVDLESLKLELELFR